MKKIILALVLILFGNGAFALEECGKDFKSEKTAYCKENLNVYFEGKKLEGADPKTFEVLGCRHGKDKNFVYSDGEKINGADGKTFEILRKSYSKDKNFVYFYLEKIEGADPKTFEIIYYNGAGEDIFSRDKNFVYYS